MAVDFPKFFTTAAELYELWPSLFTWGAGLIVPILGIIVTASWLMRGYKAGAREAVLEGEKVGLMGQIEVLQQRLSLAIELQKAATEQAKSFEAQLGKLREKMAKDLLFDKELQVATAKLDIALGKLLTANSAVSGTLTPPSGTGYGSEWRVMDGGQGITPMVRK